MANDPKSDKLDITKKPDVLFHGSSNRDITEFEPRADTVRHPDTGPVVFGTPDRIYAMAFMPASDNSWINISRWRDESGVGNWKVIISDKERFLANDNGGAIYTLPSDTFLGFEGNDMAETEWISRAPVKPIHKEVFDSVFRLMLESGVEIFFVDKATWRAIEESDDHGFEIVSGLTPERINTEN